MFSYRSSYTTDQVGSTRVVTDDQGNMVYAAAHDPYGGVQHTWVNLFNPELKFSAKEKDAESGLYYFGARYYDPTIYRFLSPDPVIPTEKVLYNPQRWNLYGYCQNNPVCYLDSYGEDSKYYLKIIRFCYSERGMFSIYHLEVGDRIIQHGFILEPALNQGKGPILAGTYEARIYCWGRKRYYVWRLQNVPNYEGILIHAGNVQADTSGCLLPGGGLSLSEAKITGSRVASDDLVMGPLFEEIVPGIKALEDMSLIVQIYDGGGFVQDEPEYMIVVAWFVVYII